MENHKVVNGKSVALTFEEIAEIEARHAAEATQQAELYKTEHQRQRATEYPPIGDQLDALWKGGDAYAAMLAQVQAVKSKYPKP